MLLQELNRRGTTGVASLQAPGHGWVGVWWGDRVKCLGLAVRLSNLINADIDEHGDPLMDVDEDEEGEDALPAPSFGHYL